MFNFHPKGTECLSLPTLHSDKSLNSSSLHSGDFSIDSPPSSNVRRNSNLSPFGCEKIIFDSDSVSANPMNSATVVETSIDHPNTDDDYYAFLEKIRIEIEKMDKMHHIKILKILKNHKNIKLNENKSGVFVNMSFLPRDVIETLVKYLDYIREQEKYISNVETQQESLKTLLS